MQCHHALLITALTATIGCGDNKSATPDAGPPDSGSAACTLEIEPAALEGGMWDPRFTIPGFTRSDGIAPRVYDFARDIDGSIVATGEFDYLGGQHVKPLMRWKNGAWVPARTTWELEPPGAGFAAIAIDGAGRLALATNDDFGERDGEIWLDDGTGLRVIGAFNGQIRTLAWYDGKLWAAGMIEMTNTAVAIQGLALWNGTTWTPPPGGALDGIAYEIALDGSEVLVGGSFAHVGGIAADNVAAFNGTTWRALDFPNVTVYALARDAANKLHAGGTFGDLFGATGGIAVWTGTRWQLAAGGLANRALVGVASDLVLHAGSLYVSGCFRTVGGAEDDPGAVVSREVARLDGQGQWHTLDNDTKFVLASWFEPRACGDEGPDSVWGVSKQRLMSDGDRILLGGSFPGVAGVQSQAVIAHDGSAWVAQSPGGLGIGGSIDRLGASSDCDVWGLGSRITHAGSTAMPPGPRVVHFTGTDWEVISDSLPPGSDCLGFAVSTTGEVSAGCWIYTEDGDIISRLYRVSGNQLVQVGGDVPLVHALAYDPDGKLWVAGSGPTNYVGRLDGETLTIIEDGFDAPVDLLDPVSGTDVIVGGGFTKIGTLDAPHIARWSGSSWQPLGPGLPGTPTAITHDATKVYASNNDEGAGRFLLGAFDGSSWTELATTASGITPDISSSINVVRVVGNALVVAGTVELDDKSGRGAFVFEAGRFRPIGDGVQAIFLTALAITGDAIWIGGGVATAGKAENATPSVGIARYVIAK